MKDVFKFLIIIIPVVAILLGTYLFLGALLGSPTVREPLSTAVAALTLARERPSIYIETEEVLFDPFDKLSAADLESLDVIGAGQVCLSLGTGAGGFEPGNGERFELKASMPQEIIWHGYPVGDITYAQSAKIGIVCSSGWENLRADLMAYGRLSQDLEKNCGKQNLCTASGLCCALILQQS